MADVTLRAITKSFGDVRIIKGIDLEIADGEFCVFVGPSGCGKSTLLRMIAGLEDITSGSLSIGGREMADVEPAGRGVAMVFQSYALYPHMTVRDNISFGLRMTGHKPADIEARLRRAADMLQLTHLLDRKPSQLSGGQRQRVAIGRAIVREPQVFLFDEPLSNLDAALRVQMRTEIGKLHADLRATMIYVTHDQVEAMTMAGKIVVLNAGAVEQAGSPLELYHRPRNLFVAGFIGSPRMNFVAGTAAPAAHGRIEVVLGDGARVLLDGRGATVTAAQPVTLGIRPEHLTAGGGGLRATVRLAEYLGSETMFYAQLADGSGIAVKADGLAKAAAGSTLDIGINPAACHLFDKDGVAVIHGDLTR
ncbi:sn-glycerol-3-phosphate ABC transporter ATP-binding protein UgpC [Aestuariivirga sp.]|uniref:ABC transporter ATP-binding protein n=1 Tax=Aestuariivirga sp. TaxID=2650926 RepID=UPI0025C016E6|nr:sn-glycerol-3-phosphate ABC transporter ATP-binding protein UgpC [Aestuariivirga sp.]MCA3554775.1 sn-glycerol-3-phosphate ABC transporter ATP-binding protein UgpC [Aestuariivirga sp.]